MPLIETDQNMLWFYGGSGTGKSYTARKMWPEAYIKQANKWWDDYKQEPCTLIEDFDIIHDKLAHHLKIWADC